MHAGGDDDMLRCRGFCSLNNRSIKFQQSHVYTVYVIIRIPNSNIPNSNHSAQALVLELGNSNSSSCNFLFLHTRRSLFSRTELSYSKIIFKAIIR